MFALLMFQALERAESSRQRVGVALAQTGGAGVDVAEVRTDSAAEEGGLRVGDRVVRIGTEEIRRLADWDRVANTFERGVPVPFEVEREGARLRFSIAPGEPAGWPEFIFVVITVMAYWALVLLVLVQSSDHLRGRLLLAFSVAVALELAMPTGGSGPFLLTAVLVSLFYLITGLQIGLELHLASLIPGRPDWLQRRRWVVPCYYVTGLGPAAFATFALMTEDVLGRRMLPWSSLEVERALLGYGLPIWAVALAVLLASQAWRSPEPVGRRQAAVVLAGMTPWLIFVLATAPWIRSGEILGRWQTLEPLVLLFYPVAVFVAIFKFHLLDLELAVRRDLVYNLVTGILLLLFYASIGAGGALVSRGVGEAGSVWVISGATLLLGLLFGPLRRALHHMIERRFFPEREALRQRLIDLAADLPAEGKLPRMGERLVSGLGEIFDARSATLTIADPASHLLTTLSSRGVPGSGLWPLLTLQDPAVVAVEKARRALPIDQLAPLSEPFAHFAENVRAELAIPLLSRDRLVGLLLLGERPVGAFTAEQVELLSLLSHQVASVLENARLFESATYESLTGMLRREAILSKLDEEFDRALRYGRPLTIGLADLDHFKGINDRFGHLAGDGLLRLLARSIQDELRHTDAVGRYGGEEFLLVLPETDLPGAAAVAEKLLKAVRETTLPAKEGEARVTVSIGLASLADLAPLGNSQGGAASPIAEDLIAAADESLYAAKEEGRDRVYPDVAGPSTLPRSATIRA
ncbi:MAG: diguanylate cyclase [Acidobacteriota bacterium]